MSSLVTISNVQNLKNIKKYLVKTWIVALVSAKTYVTLIFIFGICESILRTFYPE